VFLCFCVCLRTRRFSFREGKKKEKTKKFNPNKSTDNKNEETKRKKKKNKKGRKIIKKKEEKENNKRKKGKKKKKKKAGPHSGGKPVPFPTGDFDKTKDQAQPNPVRGGVGGPLEGGHMNALGEIKRIAAIGKVVDLSPC